MYLSLIEQGACVEYILKIVCFRDGVLFLVDLLPIYSD
jgi:hypothetical protein